MENWVHVYVPGMYVLQDGSIVFDELKRAEHLGVFEGGGDDARRRVAEVLECLAAFLAPYERPTRAEGGGASYCFRLRTCRRRATRWPTSSEANCKRVANEPVCRDRNAAARAHCFAFESPCETAPFR